MDVIGWDINPDATIDLASLLQRAQTNAAVAPVEDRSRKVAKMKADSDIYDWWSQNNGGGSGWWQEGTSNALESKPSEAESNNSLPLYVTFFQDVLPPVVQEYILSENYDLKNEDMSGGEQLVFNFENSQDTIAEHPKVKDWLLSGVFLSEDLISDLLEGSSRFTTIQNDYLLSHARGLKYLITI